LGSSFLSQTEKILALTSAANVDIEPIWASLLAKALEGRNVKELLSNVGAGGAAAAVGGAAPAAAAAEAAAPAEEAAETKEEKEESDDDMASFCFAFSFVRFSHFAICAGLRAVRLISRICTCYFTIAHSIELHAARARILRQ
jgi:large subunit ribosomal protein LP1